MFKYKIAIYLPSHNQRDIDQLARKMSLVFGGCTCHMADGSWINGDGKLILDPITICTSFADMLGPTAYGIALDLARSVCIEFDQDCVSLEFNNKLYFIGRD